MKKASLISTIILGTLGIVIGILFAAITNVILTVIFVICGILTLLSGIPQLVSAITGLTEKKAVAVFDLVMSLITIAVGIMLIFSKNEVIMLIVGLYLIVFPIIRTLLAKEKLDALKSELLSIIIGIALVIIGPSAAIDTVAKVVGIIIAVLSALYIVVGIIAYVKGQRDAKKAVHTTGNRVFIDEDGDGSVDKVVVDDEK